ncbi:hypothetical protein [Pedobacter cryoconitis]|uniref:Uncharacterized protein n=1 Tax=Pedobacter cryoconitis TaxID=188932 RepID=A0A327RTR4_9SPHI|nr:hypothetical protein [Pedobacter cryoconitis]RAJ19885.1 hypothetical protein LY11_05257 [Pedobacter cryoconitis]
MELQYGKQIGINELGGLTIDLFLFACNHEKRVYSAYDKLAGVNKISKVIGLCYKQVKKKKDDIEFIQVNSHIEIYNLLESIFISSQLKEINIIVDYSCMTKSWYYSIILFLAKRDINLSKVKAYFLYTPSKYSVPQKPKYNSDIAPLPGKYVVPTNKPKALIVCLGYEQNKAEGIIDHLDPKICYVFYTDPAIDPKFVDIVKRNNQNILDHYKNIVTYPFEDLLFLERQLTSIYYLLKDDYSIIIAPLGPKPFTFISMLMSVKYPDIDIWRVGSGSNINEYKREPINEDTFIISEVVFSNETC